MLKRTVYADNSATTRVSDNALHAMLPYFQEKFGNASSLHAAGREAARALIHARKQVADALNAEPNEIYFTSGGTEADNWAIKGGCAQQLKKGKRHIITTVFEHHAVLHCFELLEKSGFEVTYLPVSKDGYVTAQQVADAIRDDTALVSIMYANNEIGTIQPIAEIGKICRDKGVWFHTDAVQAVGNVPIDVKAQNIDMLSLSGHKIHAPKGIGVLYVRKGIVLQNLVDGGAQERNKRGGTENIASIVALGQAITDAAENVDAKVERLTKMRDRLIDGVLSTIPKSRLNGGREPRLCMSANFSFEGIEGEGMLLLLDMEGICASSGSACTSGSLDPSHVLMAIGLPHEIAHGSLRISFSEENTEEDVDYILEKLPPIIAKLRAMSPVWKG